MALKSQTSTVWATTKFHKPWKINSGSFCFLSSVTRFPQNDSLSICLVGMATPQPQHDTPWLLKIEDGFQTECVLLLLLGVLCVCVSTKCIFWGNIFGKFVHQKKKTRQIRAKHYDLIICLLGTFVCPSQGSPSPIGGLVLIQNIQRWACWAFTMNILSKVICTDMKKYFTIGTI